MTMEEIKLRAIREAFVECGGNKTQAARRLDISIRGFRNLWNKLPEDHLPESPRGCQDGIGEDYHVK